MDSSNDESQTTDSLHDWCVYSTNFAEYLLWSATAAQFLRQKHRIIGRPSHSLELSNQTKDSSSIPNRLPVRLSFEEVAHLLHIGAINGIQCAKPLEQLSPPTDEQLHDFNEALKTNHIEMMELSKIRKRLNLTPYYSKLLEGIAVRCDRRSGSTKEAGRTKLSVRARRRAAKLKRKKQMMSTQLALSSFTESDSDVEKSESECHSQSSSSSNPTNPLTLQQLIDIYQPDLATVADSMQVDHFNDPIPRHLPRSTPTEWLRRGEQVPIRLPSSVKSDGLSAIVQWLLEQIPPDGNSLSTVDQAVQLDRCLIFSDLWFRGYFITTSTTKMGGDFLLYEGDPLLYHANHIVSVCSPESSPTNPHQLAAKMRLANSVRKTLVLATVSRSAKPQNTNFDGDHSILYTSLKWTNWLQYRPFRQYDDIPVCIAHATQSVMGEHLDDLDSLLTFYDPAVELDDYPNGEWDDLDEPDQWSLHGWSDSVGAGFLDCASSILIQTLWQLTFVICLCFLCRLIRFILQTIVTKRSDYHTIVLWLNHLTSIVVGALLLNHQFEESWCHIIILVCGIGLLFFIKSPQWLSQTIDRWWVASIVAACVAMQLYCELRMEATNWHRIRGLVMILILKAISYANDLQSSTDLSVSFWSPYYRLLCWLSYALCPATLVFGPWFNIIHYEQLLSSIQPDATDSPSSKRSSHLSQLLISVWHAFKCLACALFCMIWSSCAYHTIFHDHTNYIWLNAYVASQSFRFSHYFVSYSSEAFVAIYGFGWSNHAPYEFHPIAVTRLLSMELPRSLVDVVVSWNLPMHSWLKQYVYKPVRPYGQFTSILATYTASSLLHGLNFQLSAVLFSIGVFAYIEYVLRERLATILDACIGSRPCQPDCKHANKHNSWVHCYNFGFGILAIFHLSYLAIMFDNSEEQLQGYSMHHALSKWSDLGFLNHYLAAATYIFYLLIS